jgi:hypothetical protein
VGALGDNSVAILGKTVGITTQTKWQNSRGTERNPGKNTSAAPIVIVEENKNEKRAT